MQLCQIVRTGVKSLQNLKCFAVSKESGSFAEVLSGRMPGQKAFLAEKKKISRFPARPLAGAVCDFCHCTPDGIDNRFNHPFPVFRIADISLVTVVNDNAHLQEYCGYFRVF